MVTQASNKYQWSDAWLLMSVAMAGNRRPAEMHEIIAAGDAINRAIFTEEEFENGLCRLTNGGWIEEDDGKFKVTGKFRSLKLAGSLITQSNQVSEFLNAEGYSEKPIQKAQADLKYPGFTIEKFAEAVDKYYEEFSRIAGRI